MTEDQARTLAAALEEFVVAVIRNQGYEADPGDYLRFSDARDVLVAVLMEERA